MKCLTHGAIYEIEIRPEKITVSVEIPENVKIQETEELKQKLHDSMEYALAKFW